MQTPKKANAGKCPGIRREIHEAPTIINHLSHKWTLPCTDARTTHAHANHRLTTSQEDANPGRLGRDIRLAVLNSTDDLLVHHLKGGLDGIPGAGTAVLVAGAAVDLENRS